MDPLLNDLREKQQSFRRTVVSLAAELKDARTRLASKEHSFAQETQARQEVERKARSMEDQILQLRKGLDEVNRQLQASTATSDQYLKELDDLKSKLSTTQATADANAELAQSAQLQCFALLTELHDKSNLLKEHEDHIEWLEMQLDLLQEDLQARETCEKQLRNEILAIEQEITQATDKARGSNSFELGRVLEEVSPKSLAKINKNLTAKDEQIAKLKEEIRNMSAHWKLKTKDLESQLEKHQKTDQELKKRVLKLEFCLQEARSQMRKLQRTGERKDKALKELTEQLAVKQQGGCAVNKQSFWESSGFKILISMSMLILVVFSKSWRNRSSSRVV